MSTPDDQSLDAPISTNSTDYDQPTTENVCLVRNHSSLGSFQTCVKEQALAQISYMSSTQAALFTFVYVCISVMGALGNGLVIYVVARRSEMRTTRNIFIVNLAVSNFLLALIVVPFLWLPTYRIEFPYGSFLCKLAHSFPSTNIVCSTLTVSVIAVDRYFAVVRTRLGTGVLKNLQAAFIVAGIWCLSFALSVVYLLHFKIKEYVLPMKYVPDYLKPGSMGDDYSEHDEGHLLLFQCCDLQPQTCLRLEEESGDPNIGAECVRYYETAISGITSIFVYFVPMPVILVFSFLLTRFLARNERRQSLLRQRVTITSPAITATVAAVAAPSTPTNDDCPPSTPGVGAIAAAAAAIARAHVHIAQQNSTSATPLLRSSTSSTSAAGHQQTVFVGVSSGGRRRSRTTALLLAMAFSNAILWLPFTVISLYIQLGTNSHDSRVTDGLRQMDDAAKLISMLSVCVNPFLYGYLNTNFQREFKSIFHRLFPVFTRTNDRRGAATTLVRTTTTNAMTTSMKRGAVLLLPAPSCRDMENSVTTTMYVHGKYAVRSWANM